MEVGLYTGYELFLLWYCSRRHSHIFRDCPRTQQFYSCVWRRDSLCLLLSIDIAAWFSRLHDFECMLCHASSSTQVLFIGLWWLWKWQNEGVFWDVCCILSSQLSYFKVQLAQNLQTWCSRLDRARGCARTTANIVQQPPLFDWVKLNIDGTSKGT